MAGKRAKAHSITRDPNGLKRVCLKDFNPKGPRTQIIGF